MKKIFIFLFSLFLFIPGFAQNELTSSDEYFNYFYVDSDNITTEDVKVDENVRIFSAYNERYKEIRVIVYYDSNLYIDDGQLENYYYEYIHKWKRDSNHRFYKTTLVRRKKKFNRRIGNKRCNFCEFYILILD
jgi:hypothetical protein